jgi:hypothetical protein
MTKRKEHGKSADRKNKAARPDNCTPTSVRTSPLSVLKNIPFAHDSARMRKVDAAGSARHSGIPNCRLRFSISDAKVFRRVAGAETWGPTTAMAHCYKGII